MDPPANALDVAAFIAGHPTQVLCDADINLSPAPPHVVDAWTIRGTGPIHLIPQLCADLSSRVGSSDFVRGIHALVHESAHARGVKNEACAELTSDLGVYEVLRRFYGVAFFTSESWRIGNQVLALTRALPADYQPEGCTTYG